MFLQRCIVFVNCLILLCGGCMHAGSGGSIGIDTPPSGSEPKLRKPLYGWGFDNAGVDDLTDVKFVWYDRIGELASGAGGILDKGIQASDNCGWDPIPERGTIKWRMAQGGPLLKQELAIAGVIPDIEHFTGTVWFKYLPDRTWQVIPISKTEELRRLHNKESVP